MEPINELIQKIKNKAQASESLEVPIEERRHLTKYINKYIDTFLNQLSTSKAYVAHGYKKSKKDEELEIDDENHSIDSLLNIIEERVDHRGLNPASGGHLGYIPGGGIFSSALGDYLAAATNRYAGVFYASPGAVRVENAVLRWVSKLIGYPKESGGNLTSGGSMANLIAISTARHAHKIKGKYLSKTVIYVSKQAHHSILKALRFIGMEECVIREIPVDEGFHMNTTILETTVQKDIKNGLRPFLLCGNAGSTDAGAVDSLSHMAEIAKKNGLWFHVDAAYGGFFMLTKKGKKLLKGIELADSVILDPHKGLFIPYGLGIIMIKDVKHLYDANAFDANYMQDTKSQQEEYSPSQLSPELSKHFRGLRLWLPLKLHGIAPFIANLEEKLLLTQYFYIKVRELGFQTGPEPDLSVVIFWYEPQTGNANDFNKKILESIQKDGRIFISSTFINNQFLLRFAALSFRTHLHHVDLLLSQLSWFIDE